MVASSISKRPCLCRWRYRSGAPAPWRRWGLLLFPAATRIHLCKGVLTCHQQPSLPSSSFCLTWVTDALEATPRVTGESSRMPLDAGTSVPLIDSALPLISLSQHGTCEWGLLKDDDLMSSAGTGRVNTTWWTSDFLVFQSHASLRIHCRETPGFYRLEGKLALGFCLSFASQ